MSDIQDRVKDTLLACGVEPASESHEANVVALCDLMMMTKYGTKTPGIENLTLGSAIRAITEDNSLHISSYTKDGELRWEISSIENMDQTKVGNTYKDEDGEDVPYVPLQLGVAIRSGDLPEGPLRTTMLDLHFVKAMNAIVRALDAKFISGDSDVEAAVSTTDPAENDFQD